MTSRCQICGAEGDPWRVVQIDFNVDTLRHYKLQACEDCRRHVASAIVHALKDRETPETCAEGTRPVEE